MKHFKVSPRNAKDLKPHLFVRVIEGFRKTGAVTPRKRKARDKSVIDEENIIRFKVHYKNEDRTVCREGLYYHLIINDCPLCPIV